MKKKYYKTTCVMLAASMILSFTGCEKKAATIEGLSEEEIEEETVVADTSNKQSSKDSNDNTGADEKIPDSYRWTETLYGGSEGFESVTMQVTLEDYSDKTMDAYTFEAEDFDKDYIHSMCDSLFDGGEAEVYDYHYKTKRVYDDLIDYYETAYEMYSFCKENNMDVFSFYPKALFGMWGEWELQPAIEEFDGAMIEQDINTLRSEMEQAPEKIENDYSYQGYLGKVNGEEYYMYFGNRNYDEYISSPETTQYNGRSITIMKENLEEAYCGDESSEELYINDNSVEIDGDNPLKHRRALYADIDSGTTVHYVDGSMSEPEADPDYISQCEDFLSKLGFGNYEFTGGVGTLYWGTGITNGFLFVNDYKMQSCDLTHPDGQILTFGIKQPFFGIGTAEIDYSNYLEDENPFYYSTYIEVMINDSGILGCRIINPLNITKVEPVSGIITNDAVMDIVRDSVNYKDLWNNPIGSKVKLFDITETRLILFPIRSENNKNEYTLIPCYIFFRFAGDSRLESTPFLLVNAIDGSIVNVDKNLSNPPMGWDNGNIGFDLFVNAGWMRFEKRNDRQSLESNSGKYPDKSINENNEGNENSDDSQDSASDNSETDTSDDNSDKGDIDDTEE